MSVIKYIVPALAVAGRVAGQSASSSSTTMTQCSQSATLTITASAQAATLSGCSTFSGSIALATGITDNDVALNGIGTITGDLTADNVTMVSQLSADSLTTIQGTFGLNGMTLLSSMNFPQLTNVANIDWIALPNLQGLSFTTGVQTASSVMIQNTQLNTLDGIDLQVVDTFLLANNPYLQDVNMQLGNITTALTLEANGNNLTATFPNLDWAYNMTFRNVSSISIPSLASLNGSLGFYSNDVLTINAPNLTTIGGSLSFVSNIDLTNVSMPSLTSVGGGFQIANNTQYHTVNGFGDLQTVGGAVEMTGNFTSVVLPSLKDVKGAFNLQSTGDISSDCSTFSSESGTNAIIKGKFQCSGEQSSPGQAGSSSTASSGSTATGSSSTSTKSGGASGYYAQSAGVTGFMGVLAAIFGML